MHFSMATFFFFYYYYRFRIFIPFSRLFIHSLSIHINRCVQHKVRSACSQCIRNKITSMQMAKLKQITRVRLKIMFINVGNINEIQGALQMSHLLSLVSWTRKQKYCSCWYIMAFIIWNFFVRFSFLSVICYSTSYKKKKDGDQWLLDNHSIDFHWEGLTDIALTAFCITLQWQYHYRW